MDDFRLLGPRCMDDFRLLGPLEAYRDGRPLPLGGPKQRALLALLLLSPGRVVGTDRLIDELWGESPPRTVVASLQNLVSALRKTLGPEVVQTRPPGYLVAAEPASTDLGRVESLLAGARRADAVDRARALREALAQWRGEALAEFADEPFGAREARRLEELRLSALEDRIDADLELGRHTDLVAELEALVTRFPLRERLRGQLMLALYRSGRQGDALQAFHEARRTLDEELGIDPSPALQELHRAILRQEAGLGAKPGAALEPDHFADVVRALLGGRLVVVVGAAAEGGAPSVADGNGSNAARPPAGPDIAAHLARLFEYPPAQARDLARVSQYVALTKGVGPLYDELHELLAGEYGPSEAQRLVARLPAVLRREGAPQLLVVDTNYDDTLERAFADAGEDIDVVSYLASGRNRGKFVHCAPGVAPVVVDLPNVYTDASPDRRTVVLRINGHLAREAERTFDSFVVSEDDYIEYLARADISTFVPVAIAAKLRRSHYLFLGYGVDEWRFRVFLHRVWGDEQLSYRSWAVQPGAQPLEREFWKRRGVDVLDVLVDDYVRALDRTLAGVVTAEAATA